MSFIDYGDHYEKHPELKQVKNFKHGYNLVIYWVSFDEKEKVNIFSASGLTENGIIEILKLYHLTPALHIEIFEILEG